MASTYPVNVVQAVQWSRDNPTLRAMPLFRRLPQPTLAPLYKIAGRLSPVDGAYG